jgi:acyl-CoA synthetase (NDP forming)
MEMTSNNSAVRKIIDHAKAEARQALTAPEARGVCEAHGISVPREAVARSAEDAGRRAAEIVLGYWHTIITPMEFARLMAEFVAEMRVKGIEKPVVASLAGDVGVEEAAEYLYEHGIPAYVYSTEIPVAVLGAKYKWARGTGLVPGP